MVKAMLKLNFFVAIAFCVLCLICKLNVCKMVERIIENCLFHRFVSGVFVRARPRLSGLRINIGLK